MSKADTLRSSDGNSVRSSDGKSVRSSGTGTVRNSDLWVFGYGSLMWRPGFDFAEMQPARLDGWHRAPCVLSHVHRGTPERPGVVLGLDLGGTCDGLAYRVPDMGWVKVMDYLRGREQVTMVYQERTVSVSLADGRHVEAVTYTVDRTHKQYARALPLSELVERDRRRAGAVWREPGLFQGDGSEAGGDGNTRRAGGADRGTVGGGRLG